MGPVSHKLFHSHYGDDGFVIVGAMIGLGMGTNSLIRTVTPTAGAYMLEMWGFPSIGYSGALICSVVSTLLFLH